MSKWTVGVVLVAALLAVNGQVFADLSFEQGLSDWTVEERVDPWFYTVHEHIADPTSDRASDGARSLLLGAKVIGDWSDWWEDDWTQTIVWKGPYDLTNVVAVWVDMTDITRSEPQYYWGWGAEACLILSDGVNETRSILWDYHEENTGQYGPTPGLEDNVYQSIVTGADGTPWFRYRVPLDDAHWYATDRGGGPLGNLDLSSVYVGVVYSAYSWNSAPQTMWCEGLVDNIRLESGTVEPITVAVNVDPDTLNLKSSGQWVTVYADIPFADVDPASLALSGVPAARAAADPSGKLMAKFPRAAIQAIVAPPQATLTLTGVTVDGTQMVGSDTIRVIKPGK
jgi:hypothetical protein